KPELQHPNSEFLSPITTIATISPGSRVAYPPCAISHPNRNGFEGKMQRILCQLPNTGRKARLKYGRNLEEQCGDRLGSHPDGSAGGFHDRRLAPQHDPPRLAAGGDAVCPEIGRPECDPQ